MRKLFLRLSEPNDDRGEVASWLILMAGLAMAAFLAVPLLQATFTDLVQNVGDNGGVDVEVVDPGSGGSGGDGSGGSGGGGDGSNGGGSGGGDGDGSGGSGGGGDGSNGDGSSGGGGDGSGGSGGGGDGSNGDGSGGSGGGGDGSNGGGSGGSGGGDGSGDGGEGPGENVPHEDWTAAAFAAAGIDPADWDPEAGVDGNQQIIEDVYTYYGNLFLEDPNMQWAGMANMIGPSFAAGFYDLDMFKDLANAVAAATAFNPELSVQFTEFAANLTASELEWYETEFLKMQQEIFLDQAPAHEAYRQDGINGINAMFEAGDIDRDMHLAWTTIHEGIETGNEALIAEGNLQLLQREQFDIIRDNYDAMADRPGGEVMTYLMTLIGQPSIPGAQSYAEVFPVVLNSEIGPGPSEVCAFGVCVDNPAQVTVDITTPLPNGNIANFDDRWNLIIEDTLPAYQDVLANPGQAQDIVSTPVAERIDDNRLDVHIIIEILNNFDIDIDQ